MVDNGKTIVAVPAVHLHATTAAQEHLPAKPTNQNPDIIIVTIRPEPDNLEHGFR